MMKPQLIDSHCHLYLDAFTADIQDVIARAQAEGVNRFFLPAIDSQEHENMLNLEKAFPQCLPMMGLHPCSVKENYLDELAIVRDYLAKRKFWAVGEIGLDYYWDKTYIKEQEYALNQQIELALAFDLPVVIHSRAAIDDCIRVVSAHQDGRLRGIFHCFGDTEAHAKKIIDLGFLLGIGGVLTYKNSGLAATLASISLEHMVLETDAPYLTPVPFRGKRNESSYLKYIAEKLAEVKQTTAEEVANITSSNALKLFRAG